MSFNTLRPRQNGRHFPDDIFNSNCLNENVWTPNKISLKFVPKGLINNVPALVQTMAWHRRGGKPLSEPMMVILLTHICVTRPQWVKASQIKWNPIVCWKACSSQKFINHHSPWFPLDSGTQFNMRITSHLYKKCYTHVIHTVWFLIQVRWHIYFESIPCALSQ